MLSQTKEGMQSDTRDNAKLFKQRLFLAAAIISSLIFVVDIIIGCFGARRDMVVLWYGAKWQVVLSGWRFQVDDMPRSAAETRYIRQLISKARNQELTTPPTEPDRVDSEIRELHTSIVEVTSTLSANPPRVVAYVPYWCTLVYLATFPVLAVIIWRNHRKRESLVGMCSRCGYDLRASPVRCPECGAQRSLE